MNKSTSLQKNVSKLIKSVHELAGDNLNFLYYIDSLISTLSSLNDHYWRDSFIKKIGPYSYSYILQKK